MGYGKEFSLHMFFVLCFCVVRFVCLFTCWLLRGKDSGGIGRVECKYISSMMSITLKMIGNCNGHIRMHPNRPRGQVRGMHGCTSWNTRCVWYMRLFEVNYTYERGMYGCTSWNMGCVWYMRLK